MSLAGQLLQHRLGLGLIGGLAVDAAAENNLCVDSEDGPLIRDSGDRPSLSLRVPLDLCDGISARQVLFVLGDDHLERNSELLQDRPPLRRPRGQQERRRRRRAHARLRARQMSSAGHLRAHSAATKS